VSALRHHRYLHLDVFTDRAFSGNQLAVFPDATGLDSKQMQRIAMELALSETAFVFDAESTDTDVRVRIFTPLTELPMAGHPTIGTAFALAHEKRIAPACATVTFGLGVGPTTVALEWKADKFHFAWMTQAIPAFGVTPPNVGQLAAALGILESEIRDTALPAQEVTSGVPVLLVPIVSREAVNRVNLERTALRAFLSSAGLAELPVFVFTLERAGDGATAFSRMFAPGFGISEDPATGGASGPLGGYLVHHGAVTADAATRMVSLQGVAMGRPSRIHISVSALGRRITNVRVGGSCVLVGNGLITT
jgi:trans-2,3-dihydro-3-hydroxyanthranilate isomerase